MATTTPTQQKADALKTVTKKSTAKKPTAKPKKPARDRSRWLNIAKGTRVKLADGRTGVASYFHTHHEKDKDGKDIKSKPIGMVGVLIDAKAGAPAQVGGRKVKHVSVKAADLTVIKS